MNLQPYPTWPRRAEKVVKHYFNHRERWWEIDDRGLIEWTQDWNVIRAAGGFQDDGPDHIDPRSTAGRIISAAHARWLRAAEQAVGQARVRGTVYPTQDPNRTCYVGEQGVTVYLSDHAVPPAIVTCFRVRDTRRGATDDHARAVYRAKKQTGWFDRAAVRRASMRAGEEDR